MRISFAGDQVGGPPSGWVSRNSDPGQVYHVLSENGRHFLRAVSHGMSIQMGYEKRWPLREYPILRWQWRAEIFPEHSDERIKAGGDSVLGVYVVFGSWPFIKSIKYIWSDTLPVGETFESPFSSKARIIVVRSGRADARKWVTERRDVLADYRRLYGEGCTAPVARGIAILTDADNTRSLAIGDYGGFETLPAGGDAAVLPQ
jgi:hypothetical protein